MRKRIERRGAGQPNAALGWELDAIAAVVVGGTLLTGGQGGVVYTLVGVRTHMISREEGQRRFAAGEIQLEPLVMRLGDLSIVRLLTC